MTDWAANLAGRGLLSGPYERPAGFANLGLPAYAPSTDFPLPFPFGPARQSVPREVLEGIFAQESNFNQASWHSIAGLAGNPLVADYYGAAGGFTPGVATPDCGYGLGQVTDIMTAGAAAYDTQRKVAVDYAENAAAAAQTLASKWNQLAAAGITANNIGADPSVLENWYLAIWAYNSGLHPNTGSGPWGLGWLNNPANPAYPYNRHPFLHEDFIPGSIVKVTYDDAAHPGDWPYQEKVFGWMEVPLIYPVTGKYAYQGTLLEPNDQFPGPGDQRDGAFELARPGRTDFCDPAKDQCNPTATANGQPAATCGAVGSRCWWHYPATWCGGALFSPCHTASWTVNDGTPEPAPPRDYSPPICNVDRDPGQIPASSFIVDSQPRRLNLEGCDPATENWFPTGSFAFRFGDPSAAEAGTDMDLHQLGTGLTGHMWFTHTDEPTSSWGVTGTWTAPADAVGRYEVKAFIPAAGATATTANYTIRSGAGLSATVTINQNAFANQWASLGTFQLASGAQVSLTNLGVASGGDLAFSAIALVPTAAAGSAYAALGDSYSAGEGVPANRFDPDTNTSQNACHRSADAYPRQFAAAARQPVAHLACSGAVMDNIVSTSRYNEGPQLGRLPTDASLVTITIGGNDAGFADVLTHCVTRQGCEDYYTQGDHNVVDDRIDALQPRLTDLYRRIQQRAPAAYVVVLTYPNIFTPTGAGQGCLGEGALPASDIEWLIRESNHLDNVIVTAARLAGVNVLDERYAFAGHEICSASPYVDGIQISPPYQWFHPNQRGYAAEARDLANFVTPSATRGLRPATTSGWKWLKPRPGVPNGFTARFLLGSLSRTGRRIDHPGYDARKQFGVWRQVNNCLVRQRILYRDALRFGLDPTHKCAIDTGQWQSPYEPRIVTVNGPADPPVDKSMEIDHVVPLKDAWDLGAFGWDSETRRDFANDEDELELLAVSEPINGAKSDQTPEQWTPPNPDFVCTYAEMWVAIKYDAPLPISTVPPPGVARSEKQVLTSILSTCP